MLTLYLDTASHSHSLALCDDNKTIAWIDLLHHADELLVPSIEQALKNNNLKYEDLTHLATVTGPGGFTSLRVGITTINTLAYSLNIPSAGIHLSDIFAARTSTDSDFYWLHSTKKTHLFVRCFGSKSEPYPEPVLIEVSEAEKLSGNYVGELIPEHQTALANCTPITELAPTSDVLPQLLKEATYDSTDVQPWYGRGA